MSTKTEEKMSRVLASRTMLLAGAAAIVTVACGTSPKNEPAASTATAMANPPPVPAESPQPVAEADAGATSAAKPDKKAECDALVDDANSTLDAERIAVDKLCKRDSDCMPIKARACHFNCTNAAIPKVEEKEWTESFKKVKDGPCKKWEENECAKLRTTPLATCQERKVWCEKGHCALKDK